MNAVSEWLNLVQNSHILDIQITSDGYPVIYHDWKMFESSKKEQVDSLTLKEFLAIGKSAAVDFPTLLDLYAVSLSSYFRSYLRTWLLIWRSNIL